MVLQLKLSLQKIRRSGTPARDSISMLQGRLVAYLAYSKVSSIPPTAWPPCPGLSLWHFRFSNWPPGRLLQVCRWRYRCGWRCRCRCNTKSSTVPDQLLQLLGPAPLVKVQQGDHLPRRLGQEQHGRPLVAVIRVSKRCGRAAEQNISDIAQDLCF